MFGVAALVAKDLMDDDDDDDDSESNDTMEQLHLEQNGPPVTSSLDIPHSSPFTPSHMTPIGDDVADEDVADYMENEEKVMLEGPMASEVHSKHFSMQQQVPETCIHFFA
jgi:hypothetical protein